MAGPEGAVLLDEPPLGAAPVDEPQPRVPQAFIDRVRAGKLSEQDQSIDPVHDPAGNSGPVFTLTPHMLGSAAAMAVSKQRATPDLLGELFKGFAESLLTLPKRSFQEADEFARTGEYGGSGNMPTGLEAAMLTLGTGTKFARVVRDPVTGQREQTIGGLPQDVDFKAGAETLGSDAAEPNLRKLWEEKGIHPAEAAHDAGNDAFLKQEIAPPSIVAYHGSPHEFEAFDFSKIGTGEGAQSYGHGGYFAEKPDVAENYQRLLAGQTGDGVEQLATQSLRYTLDPKESAQALRNRAAAERKDPFSSISPDEMDKAADLLDSGWRPSKGNLYRVRINADKEHFLDWDKPLSEQSEQIRAALKEAFRSELTDPSFVDKAPINAGDWIKSMEAHFGNDAEVSAAMRDAGIPGIKYLDQGSREKGGTHNLVVFDESLVEITHKNGIALKPSEITPVRGSPVPQGTPRSELAKTGEAHIDAVLDNPMISHVIDNAVIDDTHTIPNSWGGSVPLQNPTTYRDRTFPKSLTVDEVTFDTGEPAAIHENVEAFVIEKLTKAGMAPDAALRAAYWGWGNPAEHAWYRAHGMDPEHVEAELRPILDEIALRKGGDIPEDLFKGTYPDGNPSKASAGDIAKPSKAEIKQARAIMAAEKPAGESMTAAGADVTRPESLPSLAQQPPRPPGSLADTGRKALDQLFGLGRNIQFLLDPMATGSKQAMVIAKDAISTVRRIRWEHAQIDAEIMREFDAEQQIRMWNAADEESVTLQLGESREHQGLVTLDPKERAFVEERHERAQAAWLRATDAGLVEGEGLPAYTPRMVLNVAAAGEHVGPQALNELGRNVFTRTSQMKHRSYMMAEETEAAAKRLVGQRMAERGASMAEIEAAVEKVAVARNIRALPLATARLEEAAVWKEMINKIEETGKAAGNETVAVGFKPDNSWFTIAGNPAFTKWGPALEKNPLTGKWGARTDDAGNVLFQPKPIYLPDEFRGPMTSILDEGPSKSKAVQGAQSLYGALMALKGKSMTAILNSPLIHNEVVWSKVAEAAGGREWLGFGLYFRGNRIVNGASGRAQELIERGLNPMGARGAIQDITAMMEEPNLQPGRSWTAKVLGFVPGLFDEGAGNAVRGAIDKAGNFWHNTLLWDRVRDLQFGLADHLSDRLVAKGVDRLTADRIGGHFSNIIVGSIPKEAMSSAARATANMLLFSRSFTLGNLSTFKQAALGLPKPILAQIERDHGIPAEMVVGEEGAAQISQTAKSIARRKAISTIMLSAGLYYVGNALIQHAVNIAANDASVDEEMAGYARRYKELMEDAGKDPFELRHLLSRLSPTYDNEPQKQDRAHIGYDKDGTAIYARNPTGKFGEEMVGYPTQPMTMLRRKLSPLTAGLLDVLENDKGFGRKIYDENDSTVLGDAKTAFAVAKHLVMRHLPEGQISAAIDLLHGDGDANVNKLRTFGPALGFTVSQGAPGGMARGEQLTAKAQFDARFNIAWPDIRKQIQRGDTEGAFQALDGLGVPRPMQLGLMRNALNPSGALRGRTLKEFYQYATPEQIRRFEAAPASP